MLPEPTIRDFLETARRGSAALDAVVDYNRGSDHESLSGPNAILWSRQVQRDTDLFKAARFNDADGGDLTTLIEWRYGIPRQTETHGVGTASLVRPTTSAGQGVIYRGTRIRMNTPTAAAIYYRVTADTPVAASSLNATVPIEAAESGPGSKANTTADQTKIVDPLWDTTWTVTVLACSDGLTMEAAPAYRTRTRTTRQATRPGFEDAIVAACAAVGAGNVALFPSTYNGLVADFGLNVVYVGDLGYSATPDLVRACTLALRGVRVAGDNLQVLPLSRANLAVTADVYLIDAPGSMPIVRLEPIHRKAILQNLGADGSYSYTVSGIEAAIAKTGTDTQDVILATPTSDAGVIVGGAFPQTLARYFISDSDITIRYHGPE